MEALTPREEEEAFASGAFKRLDLLEGHSKQRRQSFKPAKTASDHTILPLKSRITT